MYPRDVFDVIVLALAAVIVFVETVGIGGIGDPVGKVLSVVVSLDPRVYIILGGVLTVALFVFMVIIVPRRQTERLGR